MCFVNEVSVSYFLAAKVLLWTSFSPHLFGHQFLHFENYSDGAQAGAVSVFPWAPLGDTRPVRGGDQEETDSHPRPGSDGLATARSMSLIQ